MRWVTGIFLVLMLMPSAFADELDALIGPPSTGASWGEFHSIGDWRGFYLGGQFSYSDASGNFANATQAPIAYALRETTLESEFAPSSWPVLGSANHGAAGFEGFVGYNTQFENLVLGVEATYDQASASLVAPNTPLTRLTPADSQGNSYLINMSGSGSLTDFDFGTLRARAGWALGNFLPYGFAGLAVGHGNLNVAATILGEQNPPSGGGACLSSNTPPCTPFAFTVNGGRGDAWLYGFTVGAGMDVAVTKNFFLRAEYEFTQFAPISTVIVSVNSARVGAGFRF